MQPTKPQGMSPQWQRILLFALFSFLLFSLFFPQRESGVIGLSYTKFKDEINQGNIEQVTVKGDQITGKFKKPLTKDLKAPKKDTDVATFKDFKTTKPSLEDPDLLKLLEKQDVTAVRGKFDP
jgi:cell division protease FtsH